LKAEPNGTTPTPVDTVPKATTKPTSGPPVYYPPDHEPFSKKDAPLLPRTLERKAKSKDKKAAEAAEADAGGPGAYGGAAVIPICLPVCCAMPCVIM